ncbi:MAG: response regulator NasT [Paraglaciecola sp.]|jgi:response regulator NasT
MQEPTLATSVKHSSSQLNVDSLNVLLIDENVQRARSITIVVDKSCYKIIHIAGSDGGLLKQVDQFQPDIIVIDIESPNRDMLESLSTVSHYNPKPVVIFSSQQNTQMINLSVQSGVSVYVVGDIDPKRVKPILDVAVAGFRQFHQLKDELAETKHQLGSRISIEQAKRLLMKDRGLSEDEAFYTMRKTAMDAGQKLEDVAKTIISMLRTLDKGNNHD